MGRVREEKRREEKKKEDQKEKRREEEMIKKRKSPKKEDPGARKGGKVATHGVFPVICGSGGSKSRLAKAAGAEPAGQMRDEKLHAVVAKHISKSKVSKTDGFGALLEVEVSKKCTPLWREAKRWQAWDICRGYGKMHFAWQAQYKIHVNQSC